MIRPSQGVHIVLGREFLPGESAIMVPHTTDGRVLFAIPWHDRVVVGTTDTPVEEVSLEPRPLSEELDFLLSQAARYLTKDPSPEDVLSAFAGLRPLVREGGSENTSSLSRDHIIHISGSGLVTVAGGKWTTYRKMAEDAVDQAAALTGFEDRPCITKELRIHGYHQDASRFGELETYGADAPAVQDVLRRALRYEERLHPALRPRAGEVIWAVEQEMARTVEDFLARRTRCLLLDARASIEVAPQVAHLMAEALGRDDRWTEQQIRDFTELAEGYIVA